MTVPTPEHGTGIEPALTHADTIIDVSDPALTDEATGPLHERGRWERAVAALDPIRPWILATKPRIIELLLVTTLPTMVIAAGGWPGTALALWTLFGGALSAAGANAINNELDRDIDSVMRRTQSRPTVSGALAPGQARNLGIVLGLCGHAVLTAFVNATAAWLSTGALLFYVFVYTLGLKRRSPQAVVIGGAAGCVPVLTGWAAVTGGSLAAPEPWALFALVFWWTPPHFWALAIKYRDDYASAGVPMLPVTHGVVETTRHILLYSWLLASIVLLTIPALQAGVIYSFGAGVLTAVWLVFAHRLRAAARADDLKATRSVAMQLFIFSTTHLAALFALAMVDALVRA